MLSLFETKLSNAIAEYVLKARNCEKMIDRKRQKLERLGYTSDQIPNIFGALGLKHPLKNSSKPSTNCSGGSYGSFDTMYHYWYYGGPMGG